MMTTALSFTHLSYQVSGHDILKDLSLDVPADCYFAIAGVNGAGKSTLIKLTLDLIRPATDDHIGIFGQNNQDTSCRQQLAYLPEKFNVKKNVSGWQYLAFVVSTYRLVLDKAAVELLAKKLDFPVDRLKSNVATYSKGMPILETVSYVLLLCGVMVNVVTIGEIVL